MDAVVTALQRVVERDIASSDLDGLAAVVADIARVRAYLSAADNEVIARHHQLGRDNREADAQLLARHGRASGRDAKATVGRAEACTLVPGLGDALGAGATTPAHVDALARATKQLDDDQRAAVAAREDELVDKATTQTPEQFAHTVQTIAREACADDGVNVLERIRSRRTVRTWRDIDTGLMHTDLALDPISHEKMWTAIRAAIRSAQQRRQDDDHRTWDQFCADVVAELATNPGAARRAGIPEIVAVVDLNTLLGLASDAGALCETADGTPIPVPTLRRWCCDANILPVVLGGDGVPLDVGHAERTATPDQRRALRAMYRTCGFPGCDTAFDDCEIHHVVWVSDHGRTDLANLLPLCSRHHHLVHEGGWQLQLRRGRRLTVTSPSGSVHFDGVTTDRRPPRQRCTSPGPANRSTVGTGKTRRMPPWPTDVELAEHHAAVAEARARCEATCAELDRLDARVSARAAGASQNKSAPVAAEPIDQPLLDAAATGNLDHIKALADHLAERAGRRNRAPATDASSSAAGQPGSLRRRRRRTRSDQHRTATAGRSP